MLEDRGGRNEDKAGMMGFWCCLFWLFVCFFVCMIPSPGRVQANQQPLLALELVPKQSRYLSNLPTTTKRTQLTLCIHHRPNTTYIECRVITSRDLLRCLPNLRPWNDTPARRPDQGPRDRQSMPTLSATKASIASAVRPNIWQPLVQSMNPVVDGAGRG